MKPLFEGLLNKSLSQTMADAVVELVQVNGAGGRSEHYAFFEDKTEPAELPAKADKALKQAKVDTNKAPPVQNTRMDINLPFAPPPGQGFVGQAP